MTDTSAVDASMFPGESVPVEVGKGDAVTGATDNSCLRYATPELTSGPTGTCRPMLQIHRYLRLARVRGQRGDRLICPLWFVVGDLTQTIRIYITRMAVRVWWTNPIGRQRSRKCGDA